MRSVREGTGRRSSGESCSQCEPSPIRAESADRASDGQGWHQADPCVHPLPALGQGREGRVKHAISTPGAPKPIGPYSPAIRAGDWLFISGQIPIDPSTGTLVEGDVARQTGRVLDNVGKLLEAAGLSFASVVRTTVFLADMND